MTEPTPRIEVTVATPPSVVWNALRERESIRHWHGWEFDGLDAEIDLIYFQEVDEDADAMTLNVQGGDVIALSAVGAGTRIVLTRAPHGDDPDWEAYYDDITQGWITFLHQLAFALERHPGRPRRTLFFSGGQPEGETLAQALGLSAAARHATGDPYEAQLLGEEVHGRVYFRSEHQLGLSVDSWGDGLLVLSSVGPTAHRPEGATMAVLSTYALDESAYDELSARWSARWPG